MSVTGSFGKQIQSLSDKGYTRWIRRIGLWGVFALIVRYLLVEPYYNETAEIEHLVALGQIIPTLLLYYFFGYYVFPRYLYQLNVLVVLGWLVLWHALFYEINYAFFWYLQQNSISTKIARDWSVFQEAGYWGFVSSATASLFSFFYTFPFALILLGILAVGQVFAYRTKNLKLERDKLNLELSFLKAQVNPHFLFNTLNSVYARIFDTDEQAANLVLQLSELMRYNLYETDQPRIGLDKELAYIQNYLDLERNRLADQQVVIDYAQSGNPAAYQIAPLLLIAFVENAFKHGVKGASRPAYVQVSADITDGDLRFCVENSVPARRAAQKGVPKSGGVGLENVRRRLDALYTGLYKLDVSATEETYAVCLSVRIEPFQLPATPDR